MISETLLSGKMTIKVKPPISTDGLLIVLASDTIGVTLALTSEQAYGLLLQLEGRLAPKIEMELLHA